MQYENNVILKIDGLNKSFTATRAVVDFNLEVCKGEVRGIIGENGSGKSTLAFMLSGSLKPDSGNMYLRGEKYTPSNMLDARKKGISILVQEMGTINNLSVADNIFLGKEE
ncbi:MAG: ATP-binding cassette domain-containing protein [Flexilinea sp.]